MNYRLTTILVLVAVMVVFVLQNAAVVEIRLLFWKISMPRSLLVLLLLAAGSTIGWFARGFLSGRRKGRR